MTRFEVVRAIYGVEEFSALIFQLAQDAGSPEKLAELLSEDMEGPGLEFVKSAAREGTYPISLDGLQKYDEGMYRIQCNNRNEKERAIDCMVQHIETFHEQAVDEVTADFGKPCQGCPYAGKCSLNWLSIMRPLLDDSIINIQLGYPVLPDTQDSSEVFHSEKEDIC